MKRSEVLNTAYNKIKDLDSDVLVNIQSNYTKEEADKIIFGYNLATSLLKGMCEGAAVGEKMLEPDYFDYSGDTLDADGEPIKAEQKFESWSEVFSMCYGCRFMDRESGDCTRSKCINVELGEEQDQE